MLIKNTDGAHCKIKNIKVSGTTAYITAIMYSSVHQTSEDRMGNIHRVFSFYLKDLNDTELYKISNNNYWIDRTNNYNNDSNNIDINLYKEIILTVDITNNNKSPMFNNRWIRRCNLILIDHTVNSEEAWISENLELISKDIDIPELTNLQIEYTKEDKIKVTASLQYILQEDFSYFNETMPITLAIKSTHTHEILESRDFINNKLDSSFILDFISINCYNEPIIIELNINNLNGDTLKSYSQFFNPLLKQPKATIKDKQYIKLKNIFTNSSYIKHVKDIRTN